MYGVCASLSRLVIKLCLIPPLSTHTHTVVEYLQAVSAVGGVEHLNITCIFASSIDIELQCAVQLFGPSALTVFIPKAVDSPIAVMMVSFGSGYLCMTYTQ